MKRSLSGFKNKLLSRAVISYASLMKSKAKHLSFMVAKDYDLRQKLESDLIDILHQPFWISKDAAIAYLDMLEGDEFGQKYFLKKALKGRKDSQDYFLRRELIDFLVDVKNKHPKLASSLATEANNLMELHSLHVAGYFIDRTDPAAVSQVSFLLREASEEELEEFAKTFDLSFAMSPPEDFQYSIQSFITLALLGAKGSETSYSHLAFIQRTLAHDHRIGQSTLLEVCPGHHVSLGRFASVIPLELQELLGVEPQKLMDKEAIDLVPHLRSFQHCTAIKIAQRVFEGPAPFLRDPSANAPEYFNAIYRSLDRYYDMTHAKIWTEALCGMENFDNTIFDHFTSIQIREILYQAGDNITDPDVFDQLRQKLGVSAR